MKSRKTVRVGVLALAMVVALLGAAAAQEADPIRYVVSFPSPQSHYLAVDATVPTGGRPQIELMMPVWTPGSYLVREYSRNVEGFAASDAEGRALSVEKTRKNRWRISTRGGAAVNVKYSVYAREISVRTNWVEDGFALINGAPTFVTLVEPRPRPHEVKLVLPSAWKLTLTGLPAAPAGQAHVYRAPDYDTLVDSPIFAGNPTVHTFEVDGKPHSLVNVGEAGMWDGARAARDLEQVVRAAARMWRQLPYDKYLFLNLIGDSAGGLEHKNSTVIMTSRASTATRSAYLGWLGVASHEFFHAWNVKRLRPIELGPFDYENENYTTSLWIAEGFTEYYGDVLVYRAGLSSREEFLQALSTNIESLQATPGRLTQAVHMASYDAWIKYYRPDENSANSSVSYYTKGAVLGFLLDARIRRATGGSRTLDDVMRLAYDRYSGPKGYTPEDFKKVVEEVAGPQGGVREWFAKSVESTEELDYREALDWFGLAFREAPTAGARAWLGANTRNDNGRLVITQIRRDTPAAQAGLSVDDEILAVDGVRVVAGQLDNRLAQLQAGDTVTFLIARRGEPRSIDVKLGTEPPRPWRLEVKADASRDEQNHLNQLLAR